MTALDIILASLAIAALVLAWRFIRRHRPGGGGGE